MLGYEVMCAKYLERKETIVTSPNNPQRQEQHFSLLRRSIIGIVIMLAIVVSFILPLFSRARATENVTLPTIVSAIEAGQVESLIVRGDALVATKLDGVSLSSRKESNISTVEALQILGASPEALKTLPISCSLSATLSSGLFGKCKAVAIFLDALGAARRASCQVLLPKMKR
jgi:hypothetical protein